MKYDPDPSRIADSSKKPKTNLRSGIKINWLIIGRRIWLLLENSWRILDTIKSRTRCQRMPRHSAFQEETFEFSLTDIFWDSAIAAARECEHLPRFQKPVQLHTYFPALSLCTRYVPWSPWTWNTLEDSLNTFPSLASRRAFHIRDSIPNPHPLLTRCENA